jgi:glycosyltransferase involved in cell wall biosynthesis
MRIYVDATFLIPGRVGGAEHMVVNLVQGLAAAADAGDELIVMTDHPWAAERRVGFTAPPAGPNRFVRATRAFASLGSSADAILFTNYFTPPLLPRRARTATVIHDLQYRHHPAYFSRRKRAWLRAAHALTLRRSGAVIAISRSVRQDILSAHGPRWAPKVRTIWNPVSWSRFDETGGHGEPVGGPYLLTAAAHYPHKNLATLIRAFGSFVKRGVDPDARLVVAGQVGDGLVGVAWTPDIDAQVDEMGLNQRVIVTGYVNDDRLGDLYRGARLFAFPSLFEGFALPPVEALGFGLPVLTTRRTSIPEVTLGLADYLDDPQDHEAMAHALERMWADPDRFRPSSEDVQRVRATFDPAAIATRYLEVLLG